MDDIIVSISCLAYNHEPYIRKCLDGFLMQKCNFKFEVLIHDDASTDNTASIIREYQAQYPDLIKPIYQRENQFSKGVWVTRDFNFARAKGKYIAMCEGDDYWNDPLKLLKQVDFLEKNEDCILSFSNAYYLEGSFKEKMDTKFTQNQRIIFEDYLKNYSPTPTSTMVFRNLPFLRSNNLANIVRKYSKADYILRFHLGFRGNFHFLNDFTAVYRKHNNGITNQFDSVNFLLKNTNINKDLDIISKFKYNWFFSKHDQVLYEKLLYASCKERAIKYIPKSFYLSLKNNQRKFIGINKSLTIFKGAIKLLITKQSKLVKQ